MPTVSFGGLYTPPHVYMEFTGSLHRLQVEYGFTKHGIHVDGSLCRLHVDFQ